MAIATAAAPPSAAARSRSAASTAASALASTPILDNATLSSSIGSAAYTYSGSIGGTGQLVEGGFNSGTLTLTGANSYSGSTSINGAVTLQIGNGGSGASLASPIVYMNNASGSLIFNHSDLLT